MAKTVECYISSVLAVSLFSPVYLWIRRRVTFSDSRCLIAHCLFLPFAPLSSPSSPSVCVHVWVEVRLPPQPGSLFSGPEAPCVSVPKGQHRQAASASEEGASRSTFWTGMTHTRTHTQEPGINHATHEHMGMHIFVRAHITATPWSSHAPEQAASPWQFTAARNNFPLSSFVSPGSFKADFNLALKSWSSLVEGQFKLWREQPLLTTLPYLLPSTWRKDTHSQLWSTIVTSLWKHKLLLDPRLTIEKRTSAWMIRGSSFAASMCFFTQLVIHCCWRKTKESKTNDGGFLEKSTT